MLFKGTSTIGTKNFREEERVLKKIRETGTALDRERIERETVPTRPRSRGWPRS